MTAQIDWSAVFTARPDLEAPGYQETCEAMKAAPPRPRKATKRRAERKGRYPSAKHGVDS